MRVKQNGNQKSGKALELLPRHIGIIMDGNGRWAKKRGLARTLGHVAGFSDSVRSVIYYCRDLGIEYITLYAFSTENWKRAEDEILGIFKLMEKFLREVLEKADIEQARVRFLGDLTRVPPHLLALIRQAEKATERFTASHLNICFNYGGRDEVVRAVRKLAQQVADGQLDPNTIDEAAIATQLDTAGMPDPDLIIRPSGEFRSSNFLMWQSVYAEYYFTDTLWPDFTPVEIDKAIAAYRQRRRKFGG